MRHLGRIVVLMLACQMQCACSAGAQQGPEMDNFCVFYVRQLPRGTEFNATLCMGRDSALLLTSNLLGGSAIGVFEGRIEPSEVVPLRERLLSAEVRSVKPSTMLRPGSLTTVFGLHSRSSEDFLVSLMRGEMNPSLLALEKEILRVAEQLRPFPKHVLSASGSLKTGKVKRGSNLEFSVTLENAGRRAIKIDNPALDDPRLPRLVLQFTPDEDLEGGEYAEEPLTLGALRLGAGEPPPSGKALKLAPKVKLTLGFAKQIELLPGRYQAKVAFRNTGQVLGILETSIEGTLVIDLGTFTVER